MNLDLQSNVPVVEDGVRFATCALRGVRGHARRTAIRSTTQGAGGGGGAGGAGGAR